MQNANTKSEIKQRSGVAKYRASLFLNLLSIAATCVSQTVSIASELAEEAPGAAWRECGYGPAFLLCSLAQYWIPGALGHQTVQAPPPAGAFTVSGDQGTTLTSADGVTWSEAISNPCKEPARIACGGGVTVQVGVGPLIRTFGGDARWVNRPAGCAANLHGIAYGNGLFVAVGNEGAVVTSADGIKWTVRNPGTEERLRGIACGNGVFVAVGYAGTILTSTRGIAWTARNSGTDQRLLDVAYGNGQFVVIGWNGILLTSENGVAWTQRDSGVSTHLQRVSFGPGNSSLANK